MLTIPLEVTCKLAPKASQPSIIAMSFTNLLVSLDPVVLERSWESFARKQGCWETWILLGSEDAMFLLAAPDKY